MAITLKRMDEGEFRLYYELSLEDYAAEHVRAGNWSIEEASANARKQLERLLPNGLETEGHYLFSVLDGNIQIGYLWLFVKSNEFEKRAFIYDIRLNESERGKGNGKATMKALDDFAKLLDIKQIQLHVFAHNERAINLYKKMGYETTDYYMSKRY